MKSAAPPASYSLVKLLAAVVALAGGCASSPVTSSAPPESAAAPAPSSSAVPFSPERTARRLTILHTSDSESALLASERDDVETSPYGGVGRAVTLTRALAARAEEPVLLVSAGDTWMPAPELHLRLDGKNAVVASNNLLGYQASALGNHEWDLGEGFLADQLEHSSFPYLSATVDVTEGPLASRIVSVEELLSAGPWARENGGKLLPRTRVCLGELAPPGETGAADLARCRGSVVGLVGATTELLRSISNVPAHVGLASSLEEVRARVQTQVDALIAEGVDVIVLLSHLQGARKELQLIEDGLVGVDVIVAGGGDDRLANAQHRLLPGDEVSDVCKGSSESCYPLVRTAKDGRPVVVVATDGQLRYVGSLSVGFDERGVLTEVASVSRPWPVDEESLLELRAAPVPEAVVFEGRAHDELAPRTRPFADAAVFLEGRREEVRNRQTNLGDLSADAMLWAARRQVPKGTNPAFAVRNGGGIRAPIGRFHTETYVLEGGPVRLIDLESALRFDGGIVVVKTTHEALRETFEAALIGAGTGRGQFPQVSRGVLLEYTKKAPEQAHVVEGGHVTGVSCPGARVRTLTIRAADGTAITVVEDGRLPTPKARIDVVTLGFLAKGGDGWFPGRAKSLESVKLTREGGEVTEQWTFRAFIEELERKGEWQGGVAWPDPVVTRPETFTRIRELDQSVVLDDDRCAK